MALAFTIQKTADGGGGPEALFLLDDFMINKIGCTRVGSEPSSWPADYTGLGNADYAVWRTPASAESRCEIKAVVATGASPDTLTFTLSPLVDPSSGWNGSDFGDNPSVTGSVLPVNDTDFRYTFAGDADYVWVWLEWTGADRAAYIGRLSMPMESSDEDAFPLAMWAGTLSLAGIKTGWRRVAATDGETGLTAGFLMVLRHPSDSAKDPDAVGMGQTTLASANWQWCGPLVGFNESSIIEYPGRPTNLFLRASNTTASTWGSNNKFLQKNGVVTAWPGTTPKTTYPG